MYYVAGLRLNNEGESDDKNERTRLFGVDVMFGFISTCSARSSRCRHCTYGTSQTGCHLAMLLHVFEDYLSVIACLRPGLVLFSLLSRHCLSLTQRNKYQSDGEYCRRCFNYILFVYGLVLRFI